MYITMDMARDIFEEEEEISMIMLEVRDGFVPEEVAEDIKKKMRKDREEEEGEESFQVQTSEQLLGTVNDVMGIIQVVVMSTQIILHFQLIFH